MLNITGAPKYLKQSIIDEALRGRLTKRSINDDSVSDLLKHIANNKNKLIKEKLVRRHNLPKISTDELLFKIPSNWKWIRLGNLINLHSGLSYKKKNLSRNNSDIRIIRGGNISNNGALILKDNDYHINQKFINNENVFLHNGQLLTPVATSPKHIAKVAIVKNLTSKVVAGGFVYQLTPYLMNNILSKFLLYALSGRSIRKEILSITHLSGSALCNLPKTKFLKIIIPLPPLAEQHRIVQRLNEILPKVDDLNKDVVKLDQIRTKFPHRLKQSLLLEAMKGHLTQQLPSDGNADELFDNIKNERLKLINLKKMRNYNIKPLKDGEALFHIPYDWIWSKLGRLLDVRDGTHSTPKKDLNGVPLITSKNIYEHKIFFNNAKLISKSDAIKINKRSKVSVNDIVMPMIGTIGNPAINKSTRLFAIKNMALIKNNNHINTYYLYDYLIFISSYLKKDSSGAVQSFISLTKLRNIPFPLPPLAEQHRIVSKLHGLFNTINA